jgi:predicted aldo/keto reductase-like oxidoreductase
MIHLDTAHGYQRGKNEEMLGTVLKEVPRDSFILGTKIPKDDREPFLSKVTLSLQRLQMSYVDILYVHAVSSRDEMLDPELLETLKSLKESGRVRFTGVSTHRNEPEVLNAAADSGAYDVVLTSVNFKQNHYVDVRAAIAKAAGAGVGIVAMKTMAGGFFDKERTRPINCKAALKWVLQDPNITTSIPGITSFDHLKENTSVNFDLALTPQEKTDLVQGALQGSLYCDGCEACVPGCPKRLPIPDLMRAYMYAYGYGNAAMARDLLAGLRVGDRPCEGCAGCSASCAKDFPLREKIADIGRVVGVPEELISSGLTA